MATLPAATTTGVCVFEPLEDFLMMCLVALVAREAFALDLRCADVVDDRGRKIGAIHDYQGLPVVRLQFVVDPAQGMAKQCQVASSLGQSGSGSGYDRLAAQHCGPMSFQV